MTAWAGIGFLVFTALFLYFSQRAIRDEENGLYEQKHAAYFQQYYQVGRERKERERVRGKREGRELESGGENREHWTRCVSEKAESERRSN